GLVDDGVQTAPCEPPDGAAGVLRPPQSVDELAAPGLLRPEAPDVHRAAGARMEQGLDALLDRGEALVGRVAADPSVSLLRRGSRPEADELRHVALVGEPVEDRVLQVPECGDGDLS